MIISGIRPSYSTSTPPRFTSLKLPDLISQKGRVDNAPYIADTYANYHCQSLDK